MKITSNFANVSLEGIHSPVVSQGTEDATKWNECLSPSSFALMHTYMFRAFTRAEMGIDMPSEKGRLFSRIAVMGNFIMSMKTVQMGPGVMISDMKHFRRIRWNSKDIKNASEKTQEWFNSVKHLLDSEGTYILASPGMLMGMMNAASTTLGLLTANYKMDPQKYRVVSLRSSDDSMTKYISDTLENNRDCIQRNRNNLAMVGVNLSLEKTLFFHEGFGEYTSWYMDQGFVAQFGVETTSLRPQGKNPPDDFFYLAKTTAIALNTLTINPLGAEARLRVGIDNVRRLWKIKKDFVKRQGISSYVLLLSDGGMNPWTCANCHLHEIPLKERNAWDDADKQYLLKCMNPDNPFSEDPSEGVTYDKELGRLVSEEIEVPRTIFHYVKRSNRSVNLEENSKRAQEEKDYGEAYKACVSVDHSLYLDVPQTSECISTHLKTLLELNASKVELTDIEKGLLQRAIDYLETGVKDEERNDSDIEELIP